MTLTTTDGARPAAKFPYTLKPDRYSSHTRIASLILKRAQHAGAAPYRVLDIGCAYGFLRPYLPVSRFYLMGVDVNEKAVAQAQNSYDEVYQADVAVQPDLALGRQPDTIVFGDVLEHLADPLGVLRAVLVQHAGPGTQVIVSLPNVAHLYVRLSLLRGRFDYTERGILDRTHLRFFTMKTARALVEAGGLQLASIGATPVPLPLVHHAFGEGQALFPLHALNHWLANRLKPLLAYQFVLEAYDAAG
jgi:SAM-dependent methyltransferase